MVFFQRFYLAYVSGRRASTDGSSGSDWSLWQRRRDQWLCHPLWCLLKPLAVGRDSSAAQPIVPLAYWATTRPRPTTTGPFRQRAWRRPNGGFCFWYSSAWSLVPVLCELTWIIHHLCIWKQKITEKAAYFVRIIPRQALCQMSKHNQRAFGTLSINSNYFAIHNLDYGLHNTGFSCPIAPARRQL